jgi:kinesin family protein C1
MANPRTCAVPEPAPKQRKTLMERGGEPIRQSQPAPPSTKPANGAVKGTAANGARNGAFSSSTSRVPSAASSRPMSTSSFGSSVGHGSKPPSAMNNYRPQTAYGQYGHSRSASHQPTSRPKSSFDDRSMGGEQGVDTRKGSTPIFVTAHQQRLHLKKLRGRNDSRDYIYNIGSNGLAAIPPPQTPSRPSSQSFAVVPYRDCSLNSVFESLSLSSSFNAEEDCNAIFEEEHQLLMTPSRIPRAAPTPQRVVSPTPIMAASRSCSRASSPSKPRFLSKYSNTREAVWDTESRIENMEQQFNNFRKTVEGTVTERNSLKETVDILKSRRTSFFAIRSSVQELLATIPMRSPSNLKLTHGLISIVNELEGIRTQLTAINTKLQTELEDTKVKLATSNMALEDTRRSHSFEVDDLRRKHRNDMEDLRDQHRKETERSRKGNEEETTKLRKEFEAELDKLIKLHRDELAESERRLKAEIEDERSRRTREVQEIQTQCALKIQNAGLDLDVKEREAQSIRGELAQITSELERERSLKAKLQDRLTEASANNLTLETSNRAMKAKADFLESDNQAQSQAFADLHRQMQEAIDAAALANEKLRAEETLRRKLHNQVQELKGNIRVFCRVRPALASTETGPAKIEFPDTDTDSKEVVIQGPEQRSALGNVTTAINPFSFDRVFGPQSQNAEVFEEISQLVQSALDGYNVCIFCYGQTGSGKTFTMSAADGMIPRAVQQIYAEATRLEEKGWKYKMEGSFVEVYNENLNDLLGKSEDLDKKKLEIRHDTAKKQTIITDVTAVLLDGPERVHEMLKRATNNRSVAATKANERSSRSHSVFILKLLGVNSITGERSEGTLNLVDLAGSERLAHSQATGERLKETQSINKSLTCLGDVINALGNAKEGSHIPYRNSKVSSC